MPFRRHHFVLRHKSDRWIVFFTPTIDKEPKKIEYSQVKALMNTQNGADDGT